MAAVTTTAWAAWTSDSDRTRLGGVVGSGDSVEVVTPHVLGPRLRRGPNTCPGTACSARPEGPSPGTGARSWPCSGAPASPGPPRPSLASAPFSGVRAASPPPRRRLAVGVVQPSDPWVVVWLHALWSARAGCGGCAAVRPLGGRLAACAVVGAGWPWGLCSRPTVGWSHGCNLLLARLRNGAGPVLPDRSWRSRGPAPDHDHDHPGPTGLVRAPARVGFPPASGSCPRRASVRRTARVARSTWP